MACEICGRSSCTRSFHNLEAQQAFDERQRMSSDVGVLRCNLQDAIAKLWSIRRETIEECAAILDENARYFTGIDASVVGALHAGATAIRALAEEKELAQ